jgi:hypothetical protein
MGRFYWLFAMMLAVIIGNAAETKTITNDFWRTDMATNEYYKSETVGQTEFTFEGNGVITIHNILGSDKDVTLTCYNNGYVVTDIPIGDFEGPFDLGEYGKIGGIVITGQEDFYYELGNEDGPVMLWISFFSTDNKDYWYNVSYHLPDDFEAADPYAGKFTFKLPVTLEDGRSCECTAYVTDNTLHLFDLFGSETEVEYTLNDNGEITSYHNGTWSFAHGFYENDTHVTKLGFYGDDDLSYDANSNVVTHRIYFYFADISYSFSFVWPSYNLNTIISPSEDATDISGAPEYHSTHKAIIVGDKVMLPNFFGSDINAVFSCSADSYVTHNFDSTNVTGMFDLAEFGIHNCFKIAANDEFINTANYLIYENVKTLVIACYIDDIWTNINIQLPDSYQPYDQYEGIKPNTKVNVDIYKVETYTDLDPNAELIETVNLDAIAIDNNTFVVIGLLGNKYLTYTIDENNNISSSWNHGYTCADYVYNGLENNWIFIYEDQYLNFDSENAIITNSTVLIESYIYISFTIQLPDSYKRGATSISNIAIDANAPIEYFNLQGVRVNNPANGLFIRRQGNKSQKVVL